MCFHKWSAWSEPIAVYMNYKQQWRKCEKCNKVKLREIRHNGFNEHLSSIGEVIRVLYKKEK